MPSLNSNHNLFGYISSESTNQFIHIIAANQEKSLIGVVGKMLFFDTIIDDDIYRAIGTATSIITRNTLLTQRFSTIIAKGNSNSTQNQADTRELAFIIQAVFKKTEEGWEQANAYLDTSPITSTPVFLLDETVVRELTHGSDTAYIGYFRGLNTPLPINTPDFGGGRGAYHSGVVGKSGSGKDLALDTPIPTVNGWKTMGTLKTGDQVFNENYKPVLITHVHDIITNSTCYKVTFSDGSSLIAGGGHLWTFITKDEENINLTTDEQNSIYETLKQLDDENGLNNDLFVTNEEHLLSFIAPSIKEKNDFSHLIALAKDHEQYNVNLFLNALAHTGSATRVSEHEYSRVWTTQEAYALQDSKEFFLPENTSGTRNINFTRRKTAHTSEDYYTLGKKISSSNTMINVATTPALKALFTEVMVHNDLTLDHLTEDRTNREQLLLGLLQSADHIEGSTVRYPTSNEKHAQSVQSLAISLGYDTKIIHAEPELWVVKIYAKNTDHTRRKVVSIEKVPTVPTRCITVDGDSSLYLAGFSYIPTHNTAGYSFTMSTYMRHEQHALIVVDPQGQWANENGFVFSPQEFAKGLGRDVQILRIAEEVKLPANEELLSRLIAQTNAWSRFRRMGKENAELLSDEVASLILRKDLDTDTKSLMTDVFASIARSNRTLSRIYADDKRREAFKEELCLLCDIPLNEDSDEEEEPLSTKELEDIQNTWTSILKVFRPLLNLFANKNLDGKRRRSLSGTSGFLTDILKVRTEYSAPAPYVVIDMSPDVKAHARQALNVKDDELAMKSLLDNSSIKALILQVLFSEIKKASEAAFAKSGGNLNTQIIFDEAWRYAPESSSDPIITELSEMLEGFAFDTRKFGVGWTYILQLPTELKKGIWSQLSYVYATQGLVGPDLKLLEERYSDSSQTDIYKGFIPPSSTQVYPLMIIGSISPLIFTTAPSFLNIFNTAEEFLESNHEWIDKITKSRGLPKLTASRLSLSKRHDTKKKTLSNETRNYKIGKTFETSKPQVSENLLTITNKKDKGSSNAENDDLEMPF